HCRQHHEDRDHHRDARDGEERDLPADAQAADVVGDWKRHGYTVLNMFVMRARNATIAGTKPAARLSARATTNPNNALSIERPRLGKRATASPRNGSLGRMPIMPRLRTRPSAPPRRPMSSASLSTSAMTRPLEKPSVFRTAISVRRSRTAMLIVLAVTTRIVKATAVPITFTTT